MTEDHHQKTVVKSVTAFRTISEVASELGIAQHVLRYWEGRFPQLKPLQRAGNRRLYRPADVDLARRIHRLLTSEGYSIRGVQKRLIDDGALSLETVEAPEATVSNDADLRLLELQAIRGLLSAALSLKA